jgi:hypothetical protein
MGILTLPLGSPRTKCHLDVVLMERHNEYYKGEGGESCESEVARGSS